MDYSRHEMRLLSYGLDVECSRMEYDEVTGRMLFPSDGPMYRWHSSDLAHFYPNNDNVDFGMDEFKREMRMIAYAHQLISLGARPTPTVDLDTFVINVYPYHISEDL